MAKIRYVQLEPEAIIAEPDFQMMTVSERGVYLTLMLYLFCNGGRMKLDIDRMSTMFRCDDFEKIWQQIRGKFVVKGDTISHKMVTKKLARARRFAQARRSAGVKGAQKRWQSHNATSDETTVKESKGNVTERKDKDIPSSNTNTDSQFLSSSAPVRANSLLFHDALTKIIRPRNQSDRTCFHNVTRWLAEEIVRGRFDEQIYARVLDIAREVAACRNPAAALMARLKKELGYSPGSGVCPPRSIANLTKSIGTGATTPRNGSCENHRAPSG